VSDLSRESHLQPLPQLQPLPRLRPSSPLVLDVDGTAALAPTQRRSSDALLERPVALRVVPPLVAPPTAEPPPPPVALVLRGLLEVLSGWRSVAQLVPHTSPEIAADLLARKRPRSASRRPIVTSLRKLRVSDGVVEACAVIRRERRCGALAMRFEYGERGWLLTRLEVG
jgi:hypothetical protein